jgi:hypothetical protein
MMPGDENEWLTEIITHVLRRRRRRRRRKRRRIFYDKQVN